MKLNVWKFTILVFSILVGLFMALQMKNVNGEYLYVPLKVIHEYKVTIESERKEMENLRKRIYEQKKRIREYETIQKEGGKIKEAMFEELKEQQLITGLVDMKGPGVILVVNDGTRELYEGEDPNNVLVHDIDVLNLVNDLKIAGAEAVSINGQRVLSTSEMSCAGYTIRINNQVFAQPFIIKAIGDSKTLEAALLAPGTYAQFLKEIGLYIKVSIAEEVIVPKYAEEINYQYLQVVEEREEK